MPQKILKILYCKYKCNCGRGGIGRHARLKILFQFWSAGSIPAARTTTQDVDLLGVACNA